MSELANYTLTDVNGLCHAHYNLNGRLYPCVNFKKSVRYTVAAGSRKPLSYRTPSLI